MDAKELLTGVLVKTLNMPAEKVASLFNEDGTVKDTSLNEIVALDATRISVLKADNQTEFDNGYKKAQREVLDLREKELKQKYAITSNKVGTDLIDEIVTLKAGQKAEMEPEKVKLHPEFLKMQDELTKKYQDSEKTWKEKYDGRESEINKEKTFAQISKKADSLLAGFGLPEDENLRNNQKKLLHLELNKFNFQEHNGDFVIIGEDGKPLNDEHGHRKSFDSLVTEISSKYWPKLDGEKRQGSGASNNTQGNGQTNTKVSAYKGKIKTEQDFVAALSQPNLTAEQRLEINTEYEAATSSAK